MHDVVVVGASLAGFSAADELRRTGFDGAITIVGDEPERPYDRPPLSKQVLAGTKEAADTFLPAAAEDRGIDWRLGERAGSLDLARRTVALATGERLSFDGLVVATGARPRLLTGVDRRPGLHVLRTLADCAALRADLDARPSRVIVVGAGFIGGEVAATCRQRGHDVTMVDPLELPLVRVLGPTVGAVVADLHRSHGVDVRLGVGVDEVVGDDRVRGVRLGDGSLVGGDVVVVGIGVVPNTDWLDGSGLRVADGVVCDSTLLAAPGVVAAGDVARWDHPVYGSIRIEHWDNAIQMGVAAAQRLMADDADAAPFAPVPWFWSDQYEAKIQLAGRADPVAEFAVIEGSIDDGKFFGVYGRDGRVIGALGWNWPARVVKFRMRLKDGPVAWDEVVG